MNKYNLRVGDQIKIVSLWRVNKLTEEGVYMNTSSSVISDIFRSWREVNNRLDKERWKIINKTPTEYKIGDVVDIPEHSQGYVKNDGSFKQSIRFGNEYRNEIISEIEGDYFQTKTWTFIWFKLSDLPKKENNMTEKKIIGYRMKEEFKQYEKAACKIAHGAFTDGNFSDKDLNFLPKSESYNSLKEAGVLDQWFETVYEPEKPAEKVLRVGDTQIKVIITKEKIEAEGKIIDINDIVDLSINLGQERGVTRTIAGWDVTYPSVKIGCCILSKKDIKKIRDSYDELNNLQ